MPATVSLPLVQTSSARGNAPAAVGGWLAPEYRDRKSAAMGEVLTANGTRINVTAGHVRWLSFSEMWNIYRRVPDVRAAIDSIVRRVATWDWVIEPTVDPSDPEYESLMEEAETQRRFLAAPNEDGETWNELITKFATDLLVFDQGAIEPVKSKDGKKLKELVAVRGASVRPDRDTRGRLQGYKQSWSFETNAALSGSGLAGTVVDLKPDELIFMRLFPTTATSEGNSLMEALMDEVVAILRAAEHTMHAFDADEVPPGVLVLAGITGKAAEKASQDFREMRGQDHKIRVISTPDPTGNGIKWVELRHTPKDLAMREIVNDIRRVIYRVFGVMPVEMGHTEDVPRASAEVQLTVGASHLVNPILEMLEAKVNARILTLIATSPSMVGKTTFRFDRDVKLSSKEELEQAQRLDVLVKQGIITRNEARGEIGYPPLEGGDDATVEGQPKRLTDALKLSADAEVVDPNKPPDDDDPDGGGGGGKDGKDGGGQSDVSEDAGKAKEEDDAPGEADRSTPDRRLSGETVQECVARKLPELTRRERLSFDDALSRAYSMCGSEPEGDEADRKAEGRAGHDAACDCRWGSTSALVASGKLPAGLALPLEVERMFARARDLPSDWQPTGRFRGYRTLSLPKLGDEISGYARDIRPLWRAARDAIHAAVAKAYDVDRGGFTEETAQDAYAAIDRACEKLEVDWRAAVGPRYTAAAKIARDAASDWTGDADDDETWKRAAEVYFQRAMGYLIDQSGPVRSAKRKVRAAIHAAIVAQRAAGKAPPDLRSDDLDFDPEFTGIVNEATLLAAVEAGVASEEFRLYHWSGKLNELSNDYLVEKLNAHSAADGNGGHEWYVEWVYVSDDGTCDTCSREGGKAIRPLRELTVKPGGSTECRGNCRCVLVFWTADEVANGKATTFGPQTGKTNYGYDD